MLPMTKKLAQFIKQERKDYLAVVVAQAIERSIRCDTRERTRIESSHLRFLENIIYC